MIPIYQRSKNITFTFSNSRNDFHANLVAIRTSEIITTNNVLNSINPWETLNILPPFLLRRRMVDRGMLRPAETNTGIKAGTIAITPVNNNTIATTDCRNLRRAGMSTCKVCSRETQIVHREALTRPRKHPETIVFLPERMDRMPVILRRISRNRTERKIEVDEAALNGTCQGLESEETRPGTVIILEARKAVHLGMHECRKVDIYREADNYREADSSREVDYCREVDNYREVD